jgi:hypothetical protein
VLIREYIRKSPKSLVAEEDLEILEIYRFRKRLLFFIGWMVGWIIFGAIVIKYNEDWTWIQAFYWMVETSATVGYGDLTIKYRSTRAFMTFYIIVSTIIVTGIIRSFNLSVDEDKHLQQLEKRLTKLQGANEFYSSHVERPPTHVHPGSVLPTHSAQLLLDLMVFSGKLDQHGDIDPWMKVRVITHLNFISSKVTLIVCFYL